MIYCYMILVNCAMIDQKIIFKNRRIVIRQNNGAIRPATKKEVYKFLIRDPTLKNNTIRKYPYSEEMYKSTERIEVPEEKINH